LALWVSGAIAAAVLAAFGQDIYNSIFHRPPGPLGGLPVRVDHSSEIVREGYFVALPQKVQLKNGQLESMSKGKPEAYDWALARGGAEGSSTSIKLVVEGHREHAVKIIGVEAVKERCHEPLRGSLFAAYSAGGEENISMLFDLDASRSLAKEPGSEDPSMLSDYFEANSISLTRGEQQTLVLSATSEKSYCEFKLKFTVVDGKSTVVQWVDDSGRPFRVTSLRKFNEYGSLYFGGVSTYQCGGGWVRRGPQSFGNLHPYSFSGVVGC
jgi:hypothetical protein